MKGSSSRRRFSALQELPYLRTPRYVQIPGILRSNEAACIFIFWYERSWSGAPPKGDRSWYASCLPLAPQWGSCEVITIHPCVYIYTHTRCYNKHIDKIMMCDAWIYIYILHIHTRDTCIQKNHRPRCLYCSYSKRYFNKRIRLIQVGEIW